MSNEHECLRAAIEANTRASMELTQVIQTECLTVIRTLADVIAAERRPWASPDEAADLLGIPRTTGGHHRRRIAEARKRGLIKKFRPGRKPAYWKAELRELAYKIATGDVVI